jgi:hypothetical protein
VWNVENYSHASLYCERWGSHVFEPERNEDSREQEARTKTSPEDLLLKISPLKQKLTNSCKSEHIALSQALRTGLHLSQGMSETQHHSIAPVSTAPLSLSLQRE